MAQSKRPFDLSKFSYEAARAGVVPSLGDCAVTSRRSSAYRPRGWSSASFDTSDDNGLFSSSNTSNADMAKPERQPTRAPTEHLAEKDIGFAKFLKKHSSPTHNRVTAGGRIVPMEKKEALPRFQLPESDRPSTKSDGNTTGDCSFGGRLRTPSAEPQRSLNGQLPGHSPGNGDAGLGNFPGSQINAMPYGQSLDSSGYFAQLPYLALQPSMVYTGYSGSFTDWQNLPMLNATGGGYADVQLQTVYSTGQMVHDAEALFNNLDRQLRLIDRHRAMISHDPNLAAQRMAVVQQRAEAKEQIDRLKAQLQAEQSRSPYFHPMAFASPMSSTFMPVATTPIPHPVASPASTTASTIRPTAPVEKPLFGGAKRKAIPIVRPPPPSPTQAEPCKKPNPSSTTTKAKLAQRHSAEASHSNAGVLKCNPVLQNGCGNHNAKSQKVEVRDRAGQGQEKRQQGQGSLVKGNAGQDKRRPGEGSLVNGIVGQGPVNGLLVRPPEDVETIYELQLDAMRLPEGVSVLITLSNGARVSVPGSRLGRPQSSQMSDFEREYWGRKPKFTAGMLEKLKARATIQYAGDPISDEDLIAKADGRLAIPLPRQGASKQNASHEERVQMFMDKKPKRVQEGASVEHVVAKSGPSTANIGRRSDESLLGDKEIKSVDEMSQKGYSSVLVQNVNVQVQLPPPGLDGATDPNGRSAAVLSLTATGKQRSPRLVHRSAPNGGV